ncbi:MAG: PHP domain-containing protein [Candidatus Paceibacterota bacterium]|jgi:hypothetical protein
MTEDNSYKVLHCHTTLSDGTMTHEEVLKKCVKYGISTVAFTDHDVLMTDEIFNKTKALNHPVKFISGIEFSATSTPEVEGGISSFHIIGLFVDHTNGPLNEYCRIALQKRRERVTQLVDHLVAQGFSITEKEVEDNAEDGSVGRPHVVRAVLAREENLIVIKKTLEKFKTEAQKDPSLMPRLIEILDHNPFQLMFDLFLGNDSFVSGVYVPYLKQVSLDFAVKLIRDAGGIAILAHPSYYREKLGVEIIEKFAKEGRIDGIETVYAMTPDGVIKDEFLADMGAFRDIAKKYNLMVGGGGDFHTPEDFERLMVPANVARMQESKMFLKSIFAKKPEFEELLH